MARGATIYKADLDIADMDRNYYKRHELTLACHPSETEERMMVRLLAFVLFAHDDLIFCRGVSTQDEPDLWQKDLTGSIERWVEVGQPDTKRIRRACGRARDVCVVAYQGRGSETWWRDVRSELERLNNLLVILVPAEASVRLAGLARRAMQLQCNIQDGVVSLISNTDLIEVEPVVVHGKLLDADGR